MISEIKYEEILHTAFCQKIGLEKFYPYIVEDDLHINGKPCGGYFFPMAIPNIICLDSGFRSSKFLEYVYLHEVAHQIAFEANIDKAPHGDGHNMYFGIILWVMLARNGDTSKFKVYDFEETHFTEEKNTAVDHKELIHRFSYVLETATYYAESDLSIETIAKCLHNTCLAEWRTKGKNLYVNSPNNLIYALGFFSGIVLALALSSGYFLLTT